MVYKNYNYDTFKKWQPVIESIKNNNTNEILSDISNYFEYYQLYTQNNQKVIAPSYLPVIGKILCNLKLDKCRLKIVDKINTRLIKYKKLDIYNNSNIILFNKKYSIKIDNDIYLSIEHIESVLIKYITEDIQKFLDTINSYYTLVLDLNFLEGQIILNKYYEIKINFLIYKNIINVT